MSKIQKITPYLWFDGQAKEAATFYCSVFPNSRILSSSDLVTEFELEGFKIVGINGGPQYKFTEATSFLISCKDQIEVDHYWQELAIAGGEEIQCGWCKDKFGLTWQVVPDRFMVLVKSGDQRRTKQMFEEMMPMKKLIIADLEKAYYAD